MDPKTIKVALGGLLVVVVGIGGYLISRATNLGGPDKKEITVIQQPSSTEPRTAGSSGR